MLPPSKIDRYIVESVIGEGGMGRVYRAFDPRLGRRVALKVLSMPNEASPAVAADAAARMLREARAVAAFSHPGAVAIYDVGEVDGHPFLAMELVAGNTLRAFTGRGEVGVEEKLAWLAALAEVLGAAHRVGLVHRDVKPENVMVTPDRRIKLLDFGIARQMDSAVVDGGAPTANVGLSALTGEGVLLGTPQYMSPEQLRGEAVDGRTDQFAWGVLAYELLAGRSPWVPFEDTVQLVSRILSAPPRALEVSAELPVALRDAVLRALSKRPEERFPNMENLVSTLRSGGNAPGVHAAVGGLARGGSPPQSITTGVGWATLAERGGEQVPPPGESAASTAATSADREPGRFLTRSRVGIALGSACCVALVGFGLRAHRGVVPAPPPLASGAAESAPASAAPAVRGPLRHRCSAASGQACAEGFVAWCGADEQRIACCGPGLVAMNRDGICGCPPGGTTEAKGCAASRDPEKIILHQVADAVIQKNRPELRECYRTALTRSEELAGKVGFELELTPDGDVFSARVTESSLADPDAQICVLGVLRTMRFPPPAGGRASIGGSFTFNK